MAKRRTIVTATIYDTEGFPFIVFRGNPQDVGDACAIYVSNIASPLGGSHDVELVENRRTETGD
jgi:hypothetical protein